MTLKRVILVSFFCLSLSGCFWEKETRMYLEPGSRVPEDTSFYAMWVQQDMSFRQSSVDSLDMAFESSDEFDAAVRDEWRVLSFDQKEQCVEDFFYRRRDSLRLRASAKPYRDYMENFFVSDLSREFAQIVSMSARVKERRAAEQSASGYFSPAESGSVSDLETRPESRKKEASYYYDKAIEDSGLAPSGKDEVFVKDVTGEIKKD